MNPVTGEKPIDIKLEALFGKPPKTVMKDSTVKPEWKKAGYSQSRIQEYAELVLQIRGGSMQRLADK